VSSATRQVGGWSRRRLLMILAAVVLLILSFVFGLIMVAQHAVTQVWRADGTGGDPAMTDRQHRSRPVFRDAIAAEPMLEVQPGDSRPTAPAVIAGSVIEIPPSTVVGQAGVPTGFPHTHEGAVGQLAAIGVTVLQGMSIPHTNDVYRRWALPGGVGVDRWQMTANVQAFIAAAQIGQEKDLSVSVVAVPAAGQVKGVDGPDWLVACVLLEVRATITVEARMGYGYCERMQWQHGRWMIAPGTQPAKVPSTWPGSELSIKAGWRSWIDAAEG
jgi:hypothetical protein